VQGLNPAAAVFTPCHGSAAPGRTGLQRPSPAESAPAQATQCTEPGQCLTDLPDEVRLRCCDSVPCTIVCNLVCCYVQKLPYTVAR
jgi:hypothetical protein